MAEKRMISKVITMQDEFLDMSLSAQALYFHLNLQADDEGFVSGVKSLMRQVRATDDDLKILIAKRYLLTFESGVIVIKHWLIHNTIRQDRIQDTTFQEEKAQLSVKENLSYTDNKEYLLDVGHMSDTCQPSISNLTSSNLVSSNLVKDVIDYLNSILNTKYRYNNTRTQAQIKARSNEGFTLDDFKKVITIKYDEWHDDPKMATYLRPITLFGTNFESYLNQFKAKSIAEPKWLDDYMKDLAQMEG